MSDNACYQQSGNRHILHGAEMGSPMKLIDYDKYTRKWSPRSTVVLAVVESIVTGLFLGVGYRRSSWRLPAESEPSWLRWLRCTIVRRLPESMSDNACLQQLFVKAIDAAQR